MRAPAVGCGGDADLLESGQLHVVVHAHHAPVELCVQTRLDVRDLRKHELNLRRRLHAPARRKTLGHAKQSPVITLCAGTNLLLQVSSP